MNSDTVFRWALSFFALSWAFVAVLYIFKVVPIVKQRHGVRTLLEAGLQLNIPRHIKEYGQIARDQNNPTMLAVFYGINGLVVLSVVCFLCGMGVVILGH